MYLVLRNELKKVVGYIEYNLKINFKKKWKKYYIEHGIKIIKK